MNKVKLGKAAELILDVYVVPMTALEGYTRSVSCQALAELGYKNNLDILQAGENAGG